MRLEVFFFRACGFRAGLQLIGFEESVARPLEGAKGSAKSVIVQLLPFRRPEKSRPRSA